MTERLPAEVFPPGEFLSDELEARDWTQTELAEIIGRPTRVVNEIIAGKRGISPETARDFAAAFGTSAQFWMNLDSAYQLSKVPVRDVAVSLEAKLRERFPVRAMAKRGWIASGKTFDQLEAAILAYFGLQSVDAPINFPHAAPPDHREDLSGAQYAWLIRVRQLASALRVSKFSSEKLRAAEPELERLMVEPEEIRHVPKILAEAGVRLVIVEPIPGSKIQGVCFWLDKNTPVIGLSLQQDAIDRVWFDLWHEIEHVLRGDGKTTVVMDNFDETRVAEDEREAEANVAAADRCVPAEAMQEFILRHQPIVSEANMIGFSRALKRHPGIVAGRVQRAMGRYDLFKQHRPRVRRIIMETAVTDGYGRKGASDMSDQLHRQSQTVQRV